MANIMSRSTYESEFVHKLQSHYIVHEVSPATVRKLVEGAVAYASLNGAPSLQPLTEFVLRSQ